MRYCVEKGIPHDEWLQWSQESRAKTLAFLLYEAQTCQLCGTAEWEWEENKFAYEPEERFCRGCYLKHIAGEDRNSLPGTTIELVPVTEARRIEKFVLEQRRRGMSFSDED